MKKYKGGDMGDGILLTMIKYFLFGCVFFAVIGIVVFLFLRGGGN
jgi:hypothetical protein